MTMLQELSDTAAAVAARLAPSTVAIGRSSRGSGVVVAPGRVLTNAHNLRDRTTQVAFADGRVEQGRVLAADVGADLAVLEVDTGEAEPVTWAEEVPSLGAAVFALARSTAGERLTVGFVSGVRRAFRGPRGRRIEGGLEHTAPMARGASGGPLVDAQGRVVGINTHRLGEGFYLAQAAEAELVAKVRALAEGRTPARAELGIAVAPPGVAAKLRRSVGLDERAGVLVRGVADDSPAAGADLREGDLIVAAGGRAIEGVDDLHSALGAHDVAQPLVLAVVRGADELELTARFS
jgi:S1-C subfamily serine protease